MHEIGLMQSAIEIALKAAKEQSASPIARITLRVGEASGAVHEVLQMGFSAIVQNTQANDAALVIEPVPVVCFCPHCQAEFTPEQPEDLYYECPKCHQFDAEVRQGRDIYVSTLEMA